MLAEYSVIIYLMSVSLTLHRTASGLDYFSRNQNSSIFFFLKFEFIALCFSTALVYSGLDNLHAFS